MKKYEVEIINAKGSCDSKLFKMMAEKGDIQAVRVADVIGETVRITGVAQCHITTNDKEFDIYYYATDNGFISSGSDYLFKSVNDYLEFTDTFNITKQKTSKGFTYKASIVLPEESEKEQ